MRLPLVLTLFCLLLRNGILSAQTTVEPDLSADLPQGWITAGGTTRFRNDQLNQFVLAFPAGGSNIITPELAYPQSISFSVLQEPTATGSLQVETLCPGGNTPSDPAVLSSIPGSITPYLRNLESTGQCRVKVTANIHGGSVYLIGIRIQLTPIDEVTAKLNQQQQVRLIAEFEKAETARETASSLRKAPEEVSNDAFTLATAIQRANGIRGQAVGMKLMAQRTQLNDPTRYESFTRTYQQITKVLNPAQQRLVARKKSWLDGITAKVQQVIASPVGQLLGNVTSLVTGFRLPDFRISLEQGLAASVLKPGKNEIDTSRLASAWGVSSDEVPNTIDSLQTRLDSVLVTFEQENERVYNHLAELRAITDSTNEIVKDGTAQLSVLAALSTSDDPATLTPGEVQAVQLLVGNLVDPRSTRQPGNERYREFQRALGDRTRTPLAALAIAHPTAESIASAQRLMERWNTERQRAQEIQTRLSKVKCSMYAVYAHLEADLSRVPPAQLSRADQEKWRVGARALLPDVTTLRSSLRGSVGDDAGCM